ncbi:T9SS type A sorting domain-containing protein [Brumimicrobium aurantiacum]|uniref:T9SS C-terminal target domain-containing protein n=1 Tax=Brumimicrobium aurantiacum TaxID=1737063 RepID=A0A3E1EW40_9FLAO|nr:T9SS type A sorting domain-containing protein [Brumimicrobium aurantiacum]RFC53757.1 T9SS C-terminal target domain-containing protein [Brumimicrobium aurantiacum]
MSLKEHIFYLFCFLFCSINGNAQIGFQKVYDHHVIDTVSIISEIYLQDSVPYLTLGSGGGNPYRINFRFGKVNAQGDYENILEYYDVGHLQRSMYSFVELDTNFRGNLVNCYNDFSNIAYSFRLIEYDLNGQIYLDTVYSDFWTVDSVKFFDHSKLLHLPDSSYLISLNYVSKKESDPRYSLQGVILLRVDFDGTNRWTKEIYNDINPEKIVSGARNLVDMKDGTFMLHYMDVRHYGGSLGELDWAVQKFLRIDADGNTLSEKEFQDGQYCYAIRGSYFEEDTIYLHYYDSKLFGNSPNSDRFKHKPMLARIDENMDTVWRMPLANFWFEGVGIYQSIHKFRKLNDSTFVAAYNHHEEIVYYEKYLSTVRVLNFSTDGEVNWHRDYHYYELDSLNDPEYRIADLEVMPNGGFNLGGEVLNYQRFNDNVPYQFAYLLRTNCLGYLSPPSAALSYENEGRQVHFTNASMYAGRYTYYFGDGDSLHTTEHVDSVLHTYENNGSYTVTLIAHGCNGVADTLSFNLAVKQENTYGNIGDNYFNLYPNPVSQGDVITIETGNIEDGELRFYDMLGKFLKSVPLPQKKSVYFIEHNFASGAYSVQLYKDNKLMQGKKMVVEGS